MVEIVAIGVLRVTIELHLTVCRIHTTLCNEYGMNGSILSLEWANSLLGARNVITFDVLGGLSQKRGH